MSNFESIGTIHCRLLVDKFDLFFVPDSDHSLECSGRSYAVFVAVTLPKNDDNGKALAVPLQNTKSRGIFVDEAVPINVPVPVPDKMRDVLQFALQAAQNATKVALSVKGKSGSPGVELVGITFPV